MKISKRMMAQARVAARESGTVPGKRKSQREYAPAGKRMQKTTKYAWEPGSLVAIQTTDRAWNKSGDTGIVISQYAGWAGVTDYFDVLTNEGKIIQVLGKRLRKAD